MKAYDVTKLTAKLKSDNVVQCKNKIIYITGVVLFRWRRSIATAGSTTLTSYLDLLGVGKYFCL